MSELNELWVGVSHVEKEKEKGDGRWQMADSRWGVIYPCSSSIKSYT
jgi:hypothetical protein